MSSAITRPGRDRHALIWLAFAVLGVATAVVLLEFPGGGVLLIVAALVGIALRPPRGAATAGLVTGLGGTWTALFVRVKVSCDAFNAQPGQGCESPGIEGWIAGSAVVLAVGLLASLLAYRRRRTGSGV